MAKQRKKRKYRSIERMTPQREFKFAWRNIKRAVKWKLLLQVVLATIVIFAIFQAAIYYQFAPIYPIYYAVLLLLTASYLILNKGINRQGLTREQLRDDWTEEQKDKYLSRDAANRRIAKKLLIFIIPFLLTFAFDIIYLMYLSQKIG